MPEKTVLSNRLEVSELVERGETQSLQNIKHEQLKAKRGDHVRSQREELIYTIDDFTVLFMGVLMEPDVGVSIESPFRNRNKVFLEWPEE